MPVVPALEVTASSSYSRLSREQDPDPSVTGSDPGADTEHLGGGAQGNDTGSWIYVLDSVLNKQAWKHTPVNQAFHR